VFDDDSVNEHVGTKGLSSYHQEWKEEEESKEV
jgi:hypothetical protein